MERGVCIFKISILFNEKIYSLSCPNNKCNINTVIIMCKFAVIDVFVCTSYTCTHIKFV